jgi:invasion protein IalB
MNRSREKRQFSLQPGAIGALAGLLLLDAISGPAHGQQAGALDASDTANPPGVEVAPRGQRPAIRTITYGDWRKFCFKPAGTKTLCRTTISGTFDTGQIALRLDVIEREDHDSTRVQLFLPVGMYLQPGVKLSVDQGSPYRLPYSWCLSNACIAADLADPKFIKDMETGRSLVIEAVDSNLLAMTTSLPLGQFASVRRGTPMQTFDQDIDE